MERLYPLYFQPLYKHIIWGGRNFAAFLGRSLGPENDYAESWEISDHGDDQSVVADGPLAGMTLGRLVQERGAELLGRHHPVGRFPLLVKFLDANQRLSVQVHPDDAQAARMQPGEAGKTEAWVVLAAEPDSVLWAGFQQPVDRATIRQAIESGQLEPYLAPLHPQPGECLFLPAGTIHALGAGLVVAEIQQTSDATFRLFDWNRVGPDGKPRKLHIDEGLEVINFAQGPLEVCRPQPVGPQVERLVACDKFVLDRWQLQSEHPAGGDNRCHLLTVLQGAIRLEGDFPSRTQTLGQTVLLPASLGAVRVIPAGEGPAIVLDGYLP